MEKAAVTRSIFTGSDRGLYLAKIVAAGARMVPRGAGRRRDRA